MSVEGSNLTKEQVSQAEARIGVTHPLVLVLRSQAPRIAQLNSDLSGIAERTDKDVFIKGHFGFLADAIEDADDFSLEPLNLVSIWGEAQDQGLLATIPYKLAATVSIAYAIREVPTPGWKGFTKHYFEEGDIPNHLLGDRAGLTHVRNRLLEVRDNRQQLDLYTHGTLEGNMLVADLAMKSRDGDQDAQKQLNELLEYHREHSTPLLNELKENFQGLSFVSARIQMALGNLDKE